MAINCVKVLVAGLLAALLLLQNFLSQEHSKIRVTREVAGWYESRERLRRTMETATWGLQSNCADPQHDKSVKTYDNVVNRKFTE